MFHHNKISLTDVIFCNKEYFVVKYNYLFESFALLQPDPLKEVVDVRYARWLLSLLFALLLVGCGANQEASQKDGGSPVGDLQTDFYSSSQTIGSPEELWRLPLGSANVTDISGNADGTLSIASCYPDNARKHLFDVTKDGEQRQVTPDNSICEPAEPPEKLRELEQQVSQHAISNIAVDPGRGIVYAAKSSEDRASAYSPIGNVYLEASTASSTKHIRLPGEHTQINLFASPNGVIVQMTDKNANEVLVGYNSSLEQIWRREIPLVESKYGTEGYEARVTVDVNGYVIVRSSGVGPENTGIVTHIDTLSPNGEELASFTAENRGHEFESSHITTVTPNRLYMVLGDTLVAYKLPGIRREHPFPVEEQLEVVVMGDSYSSGEGVEPFYPESDNCHRSKHAYAQVLANELEDKINLTSFVACSGAETRHFKSRFKDQRPQLSSINEDTDVVILTVGGNNIGFKNFAIRCFGLPPIRGEEECAQQYNRASDEIEAELPQELHESYRAIRKKVGSGVEVLVLGYPHVVLMEAYPVCDLTSPLGRVLVREATVKLNRAIKTAAEDERWNFTFVDAASPDSPFWGHELCTGDSYIILPQVNPLRYSLHPNQKGQEAYAELVIAQLKRDGLI